MIVLLLVGGLAVAGEPWSAKRLGGAMDKLRPLHEKLDPPKPGEWLYHHTETGQSFAEYTTADPVRPDRRRRVLCVQPLGAFNKAQRRIIQLSAEFIGLYFNLPVRVEKGMPLSVIPQEARRVHPQWGDRQILSTTVLDKLLKPRLPEDAVACLAFTSSDLWPGKGWNFVFGQASLRNRVGVWSLYRYGDPAESEPAFRKCLLRTIKTATHETGHMLSMPHCVVYECNVNGSNSLPESDRRPLALCPECMAKVCWATRTDPVERYRKLARFCKTHKLKAESLFYERSIRALGGGPARRE